MTTLHAAIPKKNYQDTASNLVEHSLVLEANAMSPKQDDIALVKRRRDIRVIVIIPGRFSHACFIARDRNARLAFGRRHPRTSQLSCLEGLAHAP